MLTPNQTNYKQKSNYVLADLLQRNKLILICVLAFIIGIYFNIYKLVVVDWMTDENNSHGFLIPFVTAYLLWRKRSDLLATKISPDPLGLLLVMSGSILLILGHAATEFFTMRSSLIVILLGMSLALFGREIFQKTFAPLAYLIFMVPVPTAIYTSIAFPFKMFISTVTVYILKLIGVAVMQEGNIIILPAMSLEVVDACSGVRSLMSLLALGVAYVMIRPTSFLRRIMIVSFALPATVICNMLRLLITALLVQYVTTDAASGSFHDAIGYATFIISFALFISFGEFITRSE